MPAGRYSAGRIFLQVVPSFKGFQREIDREVKKANRGMADGLEKEAGEGGRKAGRKAGGEFLMGFTEWTSADQKKLQSTFGKMLVDLDKMSRDKAAKLEAAAQKQADAEARRQEKALKDAEKWAQKSAEQLRKARVKADREAEAAAERRHRADVDSWQRANRTAEKALAEQRKIRDRARAREEADERKAMARRGGNARMEIEKAIAGIDRAIGDRGFGRAIDDDLEHIRRKAKDVSRELSDGLIDTSKARRQLEALSRQMKSMARAPGVSNEDRGNVRTAIREVEKMSDALEGAGRRGGTFRRMLRGATGDGDDGANAFRIFNYRILAVASALPLLAPLLAVAAAGFVSLGTAVLGAAAGLGVMLLGFSGVGDAVKAMGDVADNSAKDTAAAAKTMRNASRGVRDAQQALTQARVQAARSAEDSNRRIADAEERLAEVQRDATKAQEDLREARRQAQQDQDDLADKIKSGALDERQALIDLFNAQVAYNAAMADGGATNLEKEQASIDLERAKLGIKQIRDDNADLAAEQAKSAAVGVAGAENVVAAQERVNDSQKAIKDAERDVADARRDAAQAAADSALRIRDAQERLGDAQASYNEALTQTGDLGSSSMQKLETAMGKLSPAGRDFARYIHSLRDDFYALRAIAQEGLLPGVQESMEIMFKRYGPGFQRFVGSIATALGAFFVHVSEVLTSPVWEQFFGMMEKNGPLFATVFGEMFLDIATGFAGLMTALEPFTLDFLGGMSDLAQGFADWGASLAENEGFQKFMEYLAVTGPKVWEFFKQFGRALVAVGVAIAPVADLLLGAFTAVFKFIADLDPDTLAAIVTGILGFVLASQAAAGATQLLLTIMTPFHSVLGAVVFAIIALGAGLVYLYQHNEDFRESVQKVFKWIKDNKDMLLQMAAFLGMVAGGFFLVTKVILPAIAAIKMVWSWVMMTWRAFGFLRLGLALLGGPVTIVIGIITALGLLFIWLWNNNETFREGVIAAWEWIQKAAIYMWENVLKPVFEAIGAIVKWLWEYIIKPYFTFIIGIYKTLWEIIQWGWSIIGPIFELFGAVVKALWENVLGPIFGWIGDRFGELGDAIGVVWRQYIEPILDRFGLGADDLSRIWNGAIDAIGGAWERLQELIKAPMRFIVETVINKGFVAGFNTLAEFFGTTPIKPLSLSFLNSKPANNAPTKGSGSYGQGSHGVGGYATGGYTGPGTKYQPAGIVHADEYVIRKESTNKIRSKYGLQVLDYVNRYGELPGMGGYASGGLVGHSMVYKQLGAWVRANLPGKVITSDYRPGAITALGNVSNHGRGLAVDIGPPDMAAFNEIKAKFGKSILQLFYSPAGGNQVLNGKNWNSDPVTRSNHWDHIHWAMKSMAPGGALGGGGGFLDWFSNPIAYLQDKIAGFTKSLTNSPMTSFVTAVPRMILGMAKEKISDLVGLSEPEDKNGAPGFAHGGLVPGLQHNGTMMYDNGGYLPPGITQVVNMTGKPEPVFTASQFDGMKGGGSGRPALIDHLDVDLHGSDVTAGDLVSEIMYQVERVAHGGKYAGWSD